MNDILRSVNNFVNRVAIAKIRLTSFKLAVVMSSRTSRLPKL